MDVDSLGPPLDAIGAAVPWRGTGCTVVHQRASVGEQTQSGTTAAPQFGSQLSVSGRRDDAGPSSSVGRSQGFSSGGQNRGSSSGNQNHGSGNSQVSVAAHPSEGPALQRDPALHSESLPAPQCEGGPAPGSHQDYQASPAPNPAKAATSPGSSLEHGFLAEARRDVEGCRMRYELWDQYLAVGMALAAAVLWLSNGGTFVLLAVVLPAGVVVPVVGPWVRPKLREALVISSLVGWSLGMPRSPDPAAAVIVVSAACAGSQLVLRRRRAQACVGVAVVVGHAGLAGFHGAWKAWAFATAVLAVGQLAQQVRCDIQRRLLAKKLADLRRRVGHAAQLRHAAQLQLEETRREMQDLQAAHLIQSSRTKPASGSRSPAVSRQAARAAGRSSTPTHTVTTSISGQDWVGSGDHPTSSGTGEAARPDGRNFLQPGPGGRGRLPGDVLNPSTEEDAADLVCEHDNWSSDDRGNADALRGAGNGLQVAVPE
mmetsp:Transcript_48329/g.127904  ORF Transcript_48329/g.127904 Transcript_48329/m.127904 type:complete len:484 (+) Transcript_48329:19-1470(+)